MLTAIPAENDPAEGRVAATPETVKKFVGLGAEVKIQTGAGLKSGIPDQEYILAGAVIAPDTPATVKNADIVLRVRRPRAADIAGAKQGAAVVAIMDPYGHIDALNSLAAAGVSAFAMELMPRITRAQTMDVLSSKFIALSRGHRSRRRIWPGHPMMMTAAGMIPPRKSSSWRRRRGCRPSPPRASSAPS
jgi:NAD(P) transhydrogenase subunit alpha